MVVYDAGAFYMTTSSVRVETETVTKALCWLVGQDDTHGMVVTDNLRKIERGLLRQE